MPKEVDVLVIDDDRISQKVICRSLPPGYSPRVADDGESGLEAARRRCPDVVLLDVEMPGLNGYEVCDRLRGQASTRDVPIVFLSSHSTLRERMQGYEAGADDYLVKPFEAQALVAKIQVLIKYRAQREEVQAQYEEAQKTAIIAMTGSSELGQALLFIEKSFAYRDYDGLAQGLFTVTDWLALNCCLEVVTPEGSQWFASSGSIKPLEQELIAMVNKDKRFFDFGTRTIVSFPNAHLLVKNMPIGDMERYGRIKDLLPMLMSAVSAKINALNAEHALRNQSAGLVHSMQDIRNSFLGLAKSLVDNQQRGTQIMRNMLHGLNEELPRMGLDDDQEEYILDRIEGAVEQAMQVVDTGDQLRSTFGAVLQRLQQLVDAQETLLEDFAAAQATGQEDANQENYTMDVELF